MKAVDLAEIIQAGDALKQEVEATAYELKRGDPDSDMAKLLEQMAVEWNAAVQDYREEQA